MTYNTDSNLLRAYRETQENATGMGCVRLYGCGHVVAGTQAIARFKDAASARKTLIQAGYRKGNKDGNVTTFYL